MFGSDLVTFLESLRQEAQDRATTLSPEEQLVERKLGPISGPIKPGAGVGSWGATPKKDQSAKSDTPEKEAERKKVLAVGTSEIPHHPSHKCASDDERYNDAKGGCAPIPLAARANAAAGKALYARAEAATHAGDAAEHDKDAHDSHKDAAAELHKHGFTGVAKEHEAHGQALADSRGKKRARFQRRVEKHRGNGAKPPLPAPEAEKPKAAPSHPGAEVPTPTYHHSDSSKELMAIRQRVAAQAKR